MLWLLVDTIRVDYWIYVTRDYVANEQDVFFLSDKFPT